MTTTGTRGAASSISESTPSAVAPASRASLDASWMTGPSMTGSENGMPTSMASAPAASSPRRTSPVAAGSPPVTYGTNAFPPPSIRRRRAASRSATRGEPGDGLVSERSPDRLQVLVPPPRQAHQHRRPFRKRAAQQPPDGVGWFQCREDALAARQGHEALEGLGVGRARVLGQPGILEEAVLRTDARIVEPRGDGM